MVLSTLALVSMHVGILAFKMPMPHVPSMSILPGQCMYGMLLATWHAWPAVHVL